MIKTNLNKMAKQINPNSVLVLCEGETELEFYKILLGKYINPSKLRRNYSNLQGVYSLNDKVRSKIESYLQNDAYKSCTDIHVFIAYDREGPRETESLLDIKNLKENYLYSTSRIKSINEIIATQDLESWFFHDLEGVYKFLKVPVAKRNMKLFKNTEATHNRILSNFFYKHNKLYQKGKKVQGFLNYLDFEKIYSNVQELKDAILAIQKLY